MLRPEDKRAIDDLFERLRNVEGHSGPRDADAETLIWDRLRQNPAAAYYMAQTIIVQEAALRDQQRRIEQLEEDDGGGFLESIFGDDRPSRRQQSQAPQQAERQSPWGRQPESGGFLAGAAQTALGVTGGMLLGSAIAGMFGTPAGAAESGPDAGPDDFGDDGFGDGLGNDGLGGDFDIGGEF